MLKAPRNISLLSGISSTVGTPLYAYEAKVILERIAQLRHALRDLPVRILYAMKANALPSILQLMSRKGLGMECVSPVEVALALEIGVPEDEILYTPNNITDAEMLEVQAMGVLFNIGEVSRFEHFATAFPGSEVSIRLNPDIGSGHHDYVITGGKKSKFGIPLSDLPYVREVATSNKVRIVGLHQHIGSGVEDLNVLKASMQVLLGIADDFPDVRFVNFGGGINVPYRASDPPFDADGFRKTIAPLLNAFAEQRKGEIMFWFEPGRFLVAESGVLLTTANTIKRANERVFAGVDSGFNQLIRPVLYGAWHAVYNLSNPNGQLLKYDLVGNVCESGDVLALDREIQEIREGDIIAILDTGAYGIAMASEYNLRPLPAEVWIDENGHWETVSQRESTGEMARRLARGKR